MKKKQLLAMSDPEIEWKCVKNVGKHKDEHLTLEYWIGDEYLKKELLEKLTETFVNESSLELVSFLKLEKYYKLLNCLKDETSPEWIEMHPKHRRFYYRLSDPLKGSKHDNILNQWIEFLACSRWKQWLESITTLCLQHAYAIECRKFKDLCALDAVFCLVVNEEAGWNTTWGGNL
ncbi:hypothetical protein RFI_17435, partial [Reticulomyxa filosa]